jgi:transcriptional regulator with XRE-family HTH domain
MVDKPGDGPRARALAARLRQVRLDQGLTVRELALKAQMAYGKIGQWENGHRVPSVEQVATLLTAAGISSEDREEILEIARNAHEQNWLTVGINGLPAQLTGAMECERAASHIVEWTPLVMPGLLQTADYTQAIQSLGGLSDSELGIRVMIHNGRNVVITRLDKPAVYEAMIGVAALYEPIGDERVMAHQLRHLIDMGRRDNVSVQVVPLRIGWHPGFAGPFVVYRFPDASPIIHFEHHSSGAFVHAEHDIAEYERATDWIRRVALSEAESAALITKAAEELESRI